jgi:hypothetical protein
MKRAHHNIRWIEKYCCVPAGPLQGSAVRLTEAEKVTLLKIYSAPGGPRDDVQVTGPLAAYLALLHVCGPEGLQVKFQPSLDIDIWTLWRATSPPLQQGRTHQVPGTGDQLPGGSSMTHAEKFFGRQFTDTIRDAHRVSKTHWRG